MSLRRIPDLRARLASHVPHDPEEERHLSRMRALCDASGDAMARSHFIPGHFTASAFVLSPDRQSLLLIFHGKLQRWLQPGGHVDPDDTDILAAARREVHEEVGLTDLSLDRDGLLDVDIHDIPPLKSEPAHSHFDVRFVFRASGLGFAAGSDAKAARWVPLTEISEELSDRSVMRAVEKLRGG